MHYRNGREAKNGDHVIQLGSFGDGGGQVTAFGMLVNARPGNDFCNGTIEPTQTIDVGACLCDCLHLDDVAELLKQAGLDKRPSGK